MPGYVQRTIMPESARADNNRAVVQRRQGSFRAGRSGNQQ
jgi:hypothetical protein